MEQSWATLCIATHVWTRRINCEISLLSPSAWKNTERNERNHREAEEGTARRQPVPFHPTFQNALQIAQERRSNTSQESCESSSTGWLLVDRPSDPPSASLGSL